MAPAAKGDSNLPEPSLAGAPPRGPDAFLPSPRHHPQGNRLGRGHRPVLLPLDRLRRATAPQPDAPLVDASHPQRLPRSGRWPGREPLSPQSPALPDPTAPRRAQLRYRPPRALGRPSVLPVRQKDRPEPDGVLLRSSDLYLRRPRYAPPPERASSELSRLAAGALSHRRGVAPHSLSSHSLSFLRPGSGRV